MMLLANALPLAPLAKTGEAAKAGPIGLAVIILLCIVCYFLFKSMSKHLRRVRENFPGEVPPENTGQTGDVPTQRPPAPAEQRSDEQRSDEQRSDEQRSDEQQPHER